MVGSLVVMNMLTDGWYKYYVFDLPQHNVILPLLVGFGTRDIVQPLAIALCVCVIPFTSIGTAAGSRAERVIEDILILGGLFIASCLPRVNVGGYNNVLMPAYAGIAIYFGIGLALSLKAAGRDDNIKTMIILATALQFVSLSYSFRQHIPSPLDRQQGEKLQQLISSFEGEVYLSDHPWYLGSLNKPTQAHDMAIRDILVAPGSWQWKQALAQDMATAIAEKRYEAFIVDFREFVLRVPDFEDHYELAEADLSGGAFHPVTGWDRRPNYLYVRRTVPKGADADKPRR